MAKQLNSVQYKEMVEITPKTRGLRKPRKLRVKSASTYDDEEDIHRDTPDAGEASGEKLVVRKTSRLLATSREVTKLRETDTQVSYPLYNLLHIVFGKGSSAAISENAYKTRECVTVCTV